MTTLMNDANNAGAPGELLYRPNRFDDWGYIRTADGELFAIVRRPLDEEEANRHRRDKTDPFEPLARALMSALSTPNAPVEQREATIEAIRAYCQKVSPGSVHSSSTDGDRIYYAGLSIPELADTILAVHLDEAAIRKDEREPTSEMLLAGARSIGNSMGADNFMVRAKSCWDAMQAARMGTMEPRPAIRNGGKQP